MTTQELTLTMEIVQARFDKPIRQVILDLYEENWNASGRHKVVANQMGISDDSLYGWRKSLGISYDDVKEAVLRGARKSRQAELLNT